MKITFIQTGGTIDKDYPHTTKGWAFEYRQKLADMINNLECDKVIVTHGTDTMVETASYLAERIADKLIVITGAMRPESIFS